MCSSLSSVTPVLIPNNLKRVAVGVLKKEIIFRIFDYKEGMNGK